MPPSKIISSVQTIQKIHERWITWFPWNVYVRWPW
jgi:hypothetical protein